MPTISDESWDDPCATYKTLRNAYLRILSGVQESEVEYLANGVTRRVRFTQTSIKELKAEMDRAELQCQVLGSETPLRRRFAIQAGARRRTLS